MTMKKKLVVLMGGKSDEHDVSIMSAVSVMKHVDRERFELLPMGISRTGFWIDLSGSGEDLTREAAIEGRISAADPGTTRQALGLLMEQADVVFPVLHGPFGEDGTIQGLFEMLGVPYVGARVSASALCMDKGHSKRLFRDAGLPVAPWVELMAHSHRADPKQSEVLVGEALRYPVFVKPANLGSSVGISKVKRPEDLKAALDLAFGFDQKVLVEQGVDCRELECAVLGNVQPEASCVGEILPAHEFYDYEAKYFSDGDSKMIIPAQADPETVETLRAMALKAYTLLGITGLARVDFFLDRTTGAVILNEINTMPGFTRYSMYPLLWAESGTAYPDLITRLVELALELKA